MPLSTWHKVIDTNLTSAFVLSQLAYPEMKKAGGGKIINIGSMASYMGGPRWTAYGPAKAGIVQLSKNCASAWAKDNITGEHHLAWPDRSGDDQGDAGQQGVHGPRSSPHRRWARRHPG
jgi:2-deoxy-D-gluconate 3-dehydrogenase